MYSWAWMLASGGQEVKEQDKQCVSNNIYLGTSYLHILTKRFFITLLTDVGVDVGVLVGVDVGVYMQDKAAKFQVSNYQYVCFSKLQHEN